MHAGLDSFQLLEIVPDTPFIIALTSASKHIDGSASTTRDIKSILNFVSVASDELGFSPLPVSSISRKHIKQILLKIEIDRGESAHRYNKIRSYLMIIYNELMEMETVEVNPMHSISKKKTTLKLRSLPTNENRNAINNYLKAHHYRFWVFMQIFFHSGARLTEIMSLQKDQVDLDKQTFQITIKKGKVFREVTRPIKNIALPYWNEALKDAEPLDYIFSTGLYPGKKHIESYQITKRWNRHIKKKLGIDKDFYSLKHLNLDETASLLGLQDAAAMASHASVSITAKHYAVNESLRQSERLKSISNEFDK